MTPADTDACARAGRAIADKMPREHTKKAADAVRRYLRTRRDLPRQGYYTVRTNFERRLKELGLCS